MTNCNALNPAVPPINQLMQLTALRLAATIETLTAKGFTVIGIEFSNGSKPTIQVQNCAVCADMVEKGEATYYRTGGSGISRYRTGQFKVGEIRVLWTERGH
ncbi:TPA: hypothetical protein QDB15_002738 [Burkholderia vietnamiensis]|uniref:hypothetical protein n=1 Tax=Burkholderia cepacia complex TaxID=87882 RepID=UPI0015949906|nr:MULTISPECIES: hypothetical protein [Burkholderia cepacia complex]MBR7915318.1 hypothetical protein [Burkholderia vietnamiensis]MBR8150939.1 hypothetical protein [Burkholderia vietnamiensis]MBU9377395.1 hypothetical protein [Burkholderia multivorans]MCA8207479.1 hypothetical protein [Burkholderia vietnamiensis]MDF3093508.1 hypothetical protein [Burkholderia semiarida]